jgi:RNA polymerase sigma factor (sigma-70 family)
MERDQVYAECAEDLVRFATGLVGPHDAADVVSSAVLRAMWSQGWSEVEEPRSYLMRSVLNTARSHHRSTMRRRAREVRAAAANPAPVEAPNVEPEVLEAVARLSLRQRAVVVLRYWGDHTPEAIASMLGITEGSVRRHLARARQRLRRALHE